MGIEFYRKVAVDPRKLERDDEDAKREGAVRMYCAQADACWYLQLRGQLRLRGGHQGADFIYATAALMKDDLRALRAACDKLLHEYDDDVREPDDADDAEASLSELAVLLYEAANGARIPKSTWLEWAEELKKKSLHRLAPEES